MDDSKGRGGEMDGAMELWSLSWLQAKYGAGRHGAGEARSPIDVCMGLAKRGL